MKNSRASEESSKPDIPEANQPHRRISSLQKESLRLGPHSRNYLPHWKAEGATYFVTFRLADSLPKYVLEDICSQPEQVMQELSLSGREIPLEKQRKLEEGSDKIEEYLNKGVGSCFLNRKEIAEMVGNALRHFDGVRYRMHSYVIMPNHLHALVTPWAEHSLSSILHSWKSFTASQANKLIGRQGKSFWQRESYDHLVRDEADFIKAWEYIRYNPVKAGLVPEPEEWPYLWQVTEQHE